MKRLIENYGGILAHESQVFAITLLWWVACNLYHVCDYYEFLNFSRNKFYHDYNFADVFVNLKRAPESLKDK